MKAMKGLNQVSQCPGQDLNWAHPKYEYKPSALPVIKTGLFSDNVKVNLRNITLSLSLMELSPS
jgi:hypothetical protein